MIRIGCLLAFVLIVGIPVVAAKFLPWWGTLLVILGEAFVLVLGGPKLVKYGFKRFALGLFQTKSRVLKDAGVHVHRVEATTKPVREAASAAALPDADDADDDEEAESPAPAEPDNNRYVLVEFTLTPQPNQSKMAYYDPSELMLIPFDAKVKMDEDPTSSGGAEANVDTLHLIDDAGGETTDFDKLTGRSHLRAVFACPPTLRGRVKFQYYFETFGDLLLP
jgi:hypothetical protein